MVKKQCILGIDLGTMGVKTGIFDTDGDTLGLDYAEYPLEHPHRGWAEQDQNRWWHETTNTIKTAMSKANISSDQIVGIGVCGQGHGPSPMTRDGKELDKCITWVDRRTEEQSQWVKENVSPYHGNQTLTAVKILWWKQHRPEIFENTYKFLLPTNYILFRLTDVFATDYTNASATDMYDFEKEGWSDDLLDAYGIPRDKLPEMHSPWDVVGEITKKVADETGLKKGTPVVAGGGDWACTYYGAGFVKPGRAVDMTGTVGGYTVAVAAEKPRKGSTIVKEIVAGQGGSTQTAGAILRWFRDEFGFMESLLSQKTGIDTYHLLDKEAEKVEPGAGGIYLIPYFLGKGHWGLGDRYGIIFGLTLETKREQIIRAIMEGMAYEMRRSPRSRISSDLYNPQDGKPQCDEIRAIGGGGRSRVWRQIKADILGVPFSRINMNEGGTFGAAVLSGVGTGIYNDLVSPIEKMVKVIERNEPREKYTKRYDELFRVYKKLSETLEKSGIYKEYTGTLEKLELI